MIGEITILPPDSSERSALDETLRVIAESGLRYQPAAASVEGDLDEWLALLRSWVGGGDGG